MTDVSVIVLAGDRGPGDPLASRAGVPGKVLVEIGDKPMVTRVLETVAQFSVNGEVVVVCRNNPEYLAATKMARQCARIEPADGPAASAVAALDALTQSGPVLLITGDHPLLRPAWLHAFAEQAAATGADAVVGVVDYALVLKRFPGSRRTRYRFSDQSVCGTNLFYFAGRRGRQVAALWRDFEADRKRPWKIVQRLGTWNLVRYTFGRLSLDAAMAALSRRMGMRLAAVSLDTPEAAVDVDSAADLELVRGIIEARERTPS